MQPEGRCACPPRREWAARSSSRSRTPDQAFQPTRSRRSSSRFSPSGRRDRPRSRDRPSDGGKPRRPHRGGQQVGEGTTFRIRLPRVRSGARRRVRRERRRDEPEEQGPAPAPKRFASRSRITGGSTSSTTRRRSRTRNTTRSNESSQDRSGASGARHAGIVEPACGRSLPAPSSTCAIEHRCSRSTTPVPTTTCAPGTNA
jgi:hypothetical protein